MFVTDRIQIEYDHVAIVSMFCSCLFCSSWIVTTGAKLCGSMMFNVYPRPMGPLDKKTEDEHPWKRSHFVGFSSPYPGNHVASSKSSLISKKMKFHVSSSFQFSHVFPAETDCFVFHVEVSGISGRKSWIQAGSMDAGHEPAGCLLRKADNDVTRWHQSFFADPLPSGELT